MRRWICLLIVLALVGCGPGAPPPNSPAPLPVAEAPATQLVPGATAAASPTLAPTQPATHGVPGATTQSVPATSPPPTESIAPAADDSTAVLTAAREARPRDALDLARSWGMITETVALPVLPAPAAGDQTVFWATNTSTNQHFQVTATLRVTSDHLLMYVSEDITASDEDLEAAVTTFEQRGWPLLARWYDQSALPSRPITVLNADIPGVGGYYAADNELPRALNPYSNEREIVFINAAGVRVGSQTYIGVLIHEIQHLLQRNTRSDPATWFNEGSSMLSEYRAGYGDDSLVSAFLAAPDIQLNAWADSPGSASRHYGAAELFLRYLDDQIGGLNIGALARADAGDQLEQLTGLLDARYPDLDDFGEVYATWAVANLINDPSIADGRYGYPGLPETVRPQPAAPGAATIRQLGADYLEWQPAERERRIEWSGAASVPVVAAPDPGAASFWWSGRGDTRLSTLTAAMAIPETGATLRYRSWFDIEASYDYAYLTVSTDDGATWRPITTPDSTAANPLGLNLGAGWTGRQSEWRDAAIDLSPWSGQSIRLRFWLVTDEAYNAAGLALADLRIEGAPPAVWQGAGFVQIQNRLPQRWELRGVLYPPASQPVVTELPVQDGRATWTIPAGQRAVLVVVAATSATTEETRYEYQATP